MSVLALDLALVRDVLLPGLSLTPGRAMMARVVSPDEGSGGELAIAGYLLDAELPSELAAGQTLRLVVRDVSAERVVLAITPQGTPEQARQPPPAQPPPVPIALPGNAQLTVLPDGGGSAGGEGDGAGRGPAAHTLALQLELPGLGTLELRFGLDATTIRADIASDPGAPLAEARSQAGELQEALARVSQRPATVTVGTRRRPLDVYA